MNNRGLPACQGWAEFSLIGGSGGLSQEVDYLLISHPYHKPPPSRVPHQILIPSPSKANPPLPNNNL